MDLHVLTDFPVECSSDNNVRCKVYINALVRTLCVYSNVMYCEVEEDANAEHALGLRQTQHLSKSVHLCITFSNLSRLRWRLLSALSKVYSTCALC